MHIHRLRAECQSTAKRRFCLTEFTRNEMSETGVSPVTRAQGIYRNGAGEILQSLVESSQVSCQRPHPAQHKGIFRSQLECPPKAALRFDEVEPPDLIDITEHRVAHGQVRLELECFAR